MVALNAKLDNDSKCENKDTALNAKLKKTMALSAKLWRGNGFECQTVNDGSKCQTVSDGSKR